MSATHAERKADMRGARSHEPSDLKRTYAKILRRKALSTTTRRRGRAAPSLPLDKDQGPF